MSKFVTMPRDNLVQAIRKLEKLEGLPEGSREEIKAIIDLLKNDTYSQDHVCVPSRPVPSRQSFKEVLQGVYEQVEADHIGQPGTRGIMDRQIAGDICKIITEVYTLSPRHENGAPRFININSAPTDISIIQEVYKLLQRDHIELVIENFKNTTTLIKKKRPFLQTALYNAIMEYDLHYINQVKHDFGQ